MEKSHVAMERAACIACGADYDTGNILLESRFKRDRSGLMQTLDSPHQHTGTHGYCPKCQGKLDDGYIIIVAIDPTKSEGHDGKLAHENAYRSGEMCFLKADVWDKLFSLPRPEGNFAYADQAVIDHLKSMQEGNYGQPATPDHPAGD